MAQVPGHCLARPERTDQLPSVTQAFDPAPEPMASLVVQRAKLGCVLSCFLVEPSQRGDQQFAKGRELLDVSFSMAGGPKSDPKPLCLLCAQHCGGACFLLSVDGCRYFHKRSLGGSKKGPQ